MPLLTACTAGVEVMREDLPNYTYPSALPALYGTHLPRTPTPLP